MNAQPEFNDEEKPLDPATERVRRKLARVGAIFMGINIVALMAVLGAVVYKLGGYGEEDGGQTGGSELGQHAVAGGAVPIEPGFDAMVDIPDDARLVSVSETGGRAVLHLQLSDGGAEVWFFDLSTRQVAGKLRLR